MGFIHLDDCELTVDRPRYFGVEDSGYVGKSRHDDTCHMRPSLTCDYDTARAIMRHMREQYGLHVPQDTYAPELPGHAALPSPEHGPKQITDGVVDGILEDE